MTGAEGLRGASTWSLPRISLGAVSSDAFCAVAAALPAPGEPAPGSAEPLRLGRDPAVRSEAGRSETGELNEETDNGLLAEETLDESGAGSSCAQEIWATARATKVSVDLGCNMVYSFTGGRPALARSAFRLASVARDSS